MKASEHASMTCRRCGAERNPASISCGRCGEVLVGALSCEEHHNEPAIALCVVCGRPLCAGCQRNGSQRALCGDPDHEQFAAGWERLFQSVSEFEADCVARNLKANGIPVRVFSCREFANTLLVTGDDAVRVFVPVAEAERARQAVGQVIQACHDEPGTLE